MVAYFLIGVAFLLSLLLVARWVASVNTRALAKGVRYGGGAAAVGVALYLVVSGRWPYAIAALSTALPFFMRWRAVRDRVKSARGPSPGQRSDVETALLRMTLDHDTGEMSGTVRSGSQAGRGLESMSRAELEGLLEECRRDDPPSAALLESYFERRFGPDWRDEAGADDAAGAAGGGTSGGTRARSSTAMTRAEALEMLGLEEGASPAQIKEAYRRLMVRLHPDAGGSAYLATKLNQAKDLLLKRK